MTARRDLGELERTGLARRTHGGAVLPAIAAHEDSFASRLEQAKDAKAALAEAAADLVRESESLFLDSSTTSHHLARVLLERGVRATVISNSMEIFELVATHPALAIDLVGVGGALRRLTRSFVGPYAVHTIAGHAVDRVFFSVKGITSGGALTDPDALESEVKRSMIAHAHEAILLVDESKLSQHGLSVVAAGRRGRPGPGPRDLRQAGGRPDRPGRPGHDRRRPDGCRVNDAATPIVELRDGQQVLRRGAARCATATSPCAPARCARWSARTAPASRRS